MARIGRGRKGGETIKGDRTKAGAAAGGGRLGAMQQSRVGPPGPRPVPIISPDPNAPSFGMMTIEDADGVQRTYRVPLDRVPPMHHFALVAAPDVRAGTINTHLVELGVRSSLVSRVERWLSRALERMSDAEVLKVIEAQSPAETIAEILVATPDARAASDGDWAELLLRGAESKRQIAAFVGGLLTSSEAARLLGISIPGVKQRMERHKLFALPLSGGQWGFPALQFAGDGHVRPGVPEVAKAGAHVDPWTLVSILVDDVEDERGGMLLERLDEPAVLSDVLNRLATYGEHVAG
jgi:hypothetical protein